VPLGEEPAPAAPSDDDSDTALYVGAGLGALAGALAGGFLWYRRRLP
jgi:LPXTG-motif cell wall-anchored protein